MPIAECYACGDGICERHAMWHNDGYICTKCARKIGLKEYGTPQRRISGPAKEQLNEHPPAGGPDPVRQPGDPD